MTKVMWRSLSVMICAVYALALVACGDKCPGREHQLPAAWTEMNFQAVEGGIICADEKSATIVHGAIEPTVMSERYAESLKNAGWIRNTTVNTAPDAYVVEKDKKYITLSFRQCETEWTDPSTWGACTYVLIDEMPTFNRSPKK